MGKVLESWSQMLCTNFAEKPPSKLNFYCVPWRVPKVSINLGTLWEPISTANAVKLLVSIGGKNHWVCVGQAWALALRVKCPVSSERTRDAVPLACYRQRVCHLVAPVFQFSCQQQGINRFECLKQSGDAQSGIAGCSLVLAEGFWFSALLLHFSTIAWQYPVLGSFQKDRCHWIWLPDFRAMAQLSPTGFPGISATFCSSQSKNNRACMFSFPNLGTLTTKVL